MILQIKIKCLSLCSKFPVDIVIVRLICETKKRIHDLKIKTLIL